VAIHTSDRCWCEGYEKDVKELMACSREYQRKFTVTWRQLHNKLMMCRDDMPSWHRPSWLFHHPFRWWMTHPICPGSGLAGESLSS